MTKRYGLLNELKCFKNHIPYSVSMKCVSCPLWHIVDHTFRSTLSFPFVELKQVNWQDRLKHSYAENDPLYPQNTVQHVGSQFSQMCTDCTHSEEVNLFTCLSDHRV